MALRSRKRRTSGTTLLSSPSRPIPRHPPLQVFSLNGSWDQQIAALATTTSQLLTHQPPRPEEIAHET